MVSEEIGIYYKMVLADIDASDKQLKFATLEWQIYNKNGTLLADVGNLKYAN